MTNSCSGISAFRTAGSCQKRIQQAQLLIRTQEELPLSEIAAQVGYEDSSTFYRNFRKLTGMSPAQYRKLYEK